MTRRDDKCPVCGLEAETYREAMKSRYHSDCARCGGKFEITDAVLTVAHRSVEDLLKVREYILRSNLIGSRAIVSSDTIGVVLRSPLPSISERADRLLAHIASETKYPAESWKCPSTEGLAQVLVCAGIYQDLTYFLGLLIERGFLRQTAPGVVYPIVQITGAGHDHLEKSRVSRSGRQAFVAMWFDDSMVAAYDVAVAPAIVDAGWKPLRVDRKEHSNKIDDEIVAEIRRSTFVVADFSCAPGNVRGGVYFEAGLAQGLGLPVIWSCRHDCVDDLHFDTRQYNHIVWDDLDEFREALTKRILAVIGEGVRGA
jgi:hypothetical protein